jgi:hypothetical protein
MGKNNIKAYMTFSGYPSDGCELVYAVSRNQAKQLSTHNNFEWEYIDINTKRVPIYDEFYYGASVIECNSDLPPKAPKFFIDTCYE